MSTIRLEMTDAILERLLNRGDFNVIRVFSPSQYRGDYLITDNDETRSFESELRACDANFIIKYLLQP